MSLIAWRRISSWECSNCGLCCQRLEIVLTEQEARTIRASFGDQAVVTTRLGPRLAKIGDRCIFQRFRQGSSRCLLQSVGLKPSACRTYPFVTSPRPLRGMAPRESLFTFGGEALYIYANPKCPGLRLGTPSAELVQRILPEVAEMALGRRREQRYTTSRRPAPLVGFGWKQNAVKASPKRR